MLVFKMMKTAKRSFHRTTIYTELPDGQRDRCIELAMLSMSPKFLELGGSKYVENFDLKKELFSSYLTFNWNDISLTKILNDGKITLGKKVRLGPTDSC